MILPPSWSHSTDARRVAAFTFVNVGLSLLCSGGCAALWIALAATGHIAEAWPELILSILLGLPGGAGLFMLFCGTYIANMHKEMQDLGWDRISDLEARLDDV